MSEFVFKLPDLGEGTVEAEIVEWYVAVGDVVAEGAPMVDVMTDKANVEVPAPVAGTVIQLGGATGEIIAVGAALITFDTAAADADTVDRDATESSVVGVATVTADPVAPEELEESSIAAKDPTPSTGIPAPEAETQTSPSAVSSAAQSVEPQQIKAADAATKVLTSPAIRKHAAEAGIDLRLVTGSGPRGRILRKDLDRAKAENQQIASSPSTAIPANNERINVRGVRRLIAHRMAASKRSIPHFTYVEEVDVTALDELRTSLNKRYAAPTEHADLTYLPLVAQALIRALQDYPLCNAHFLAEDELIERIGAVHLGIATQTPEGLKVPVVHNAQALSLWPLAEQIRSVTAAARDGSATRAQLGGSSITITSLGRLGGIVSTPIINAPEVAIIGLNKAVPRPVVHNGDVAIRTMMNVSGSFDHRIIDGFDAASFIGSLKSLLEEPGLIFAPKP